MPIRSDTLDSWDDPEDEFEPYEFELENEFDPDEFYDSEDYFDPDEWDE